MDSKTSELILKTMLEIEKDDFIDEPISEFKNALPHLSEKVILAAISEFEYLGLIKAHRGDDTVSCIAVRPAATGYLMKLQEQQEEKKSVARADSIHQVFNFQNNYGAIGTNADFVINNTFNFERFTQLIHENTKEDTQERKELEELKTQLETIEKHNIPISKGYLARFSELMQKHSWVAGPVTAFLLKWSLG